MNRLFVHHPWFRLLSPLFSGTLVYLLMLLINNAVLYIQEDFLSQELYVCIGLAYLTQEFSRLSLLVFERLQRPKSFLFKVLLQIGVSILLTIGLVYLSMYLYFKYILQYTPNFRELFVFNSIFSFITLLYVVLYLGHYFLFRKNTQKIEKELRAKQAIEYDFASYRNGINPKLLFESLEAMLVVMKENPAKAEELTDHFSTVYRYILSKRKREMVPLREELTIVKALSQLFDHLPYRKVQLGKVSDTDFTVLPTSLLKVMESIIRTTIVSARKALVIDILENKESLEVRYEHEEKLEESLSMDTLMDISHSYRFYTDMPIQIREEGPFKIIKLPKLTYNESSHT